MTRKRKWLSIFLVPVPWALLFVNVAGPVGERVIRVAVVYLGVVVLFVLINIALLKARGLPIRGTLVRGPRTSVLPEAVNEQLPKLFWVVRNREPVRADQLFLHGQLLSVQNVAYTATLSIALTGSLLRTLSDKEVTDSGVRSRLLAEAAEASKVLPLALDLSLLPRWLVQLQGEGKEFAFARPVEFTAPHLAAVVSLGAAAAHMSQRTRQQIYEIWAAIAEGFTHGAELPASWR